MKLECPQCGTWQLEMKSSDRSWNNNMYDIWKCSNEDCGWMTEVGVFQKENKGEMYD